MMNTKTHEDGKVRIPVARDYREQAQTLIHDGASWTGPDDIQIDDGAEVAVYDEGAWVQAWIRIPKEG